MRKSIRLTKTTENGLELVPQEQVRVKVNRGAVSSLIKMSADPFSIAGGGTLGQPDFSKETGRRGVETRGLNAGPATASIINGITARRRSRFAVLASPYAKRAVDIMVSNVVGSGHKLISEAPDAEFKNKVESLWQKWCKESDTTGQQPFSGLESLAYRSSIEGGDCFVRFRTRRLSDGFSVPLQLQVIESEQVPLFLNRRSGKRQVVAGIEFDPLGEPVFYHMLPNHPGDLFITDFANNADTVPVPARDVLHIHEVRRPNDVRGMPALAQMVIKLSDLDRYMDAELVRKKAVALIGGFITEPYDQQQSNPLLPGRKPETKQEIEIEALEPGSFPILPPGFGVEFSAPADVGGNFDKFLRQQLQMIAASMNLTLEQLTGDLSDVSDRTLRAVLLEFKRIVNAIQKNVLIFQFNQPVFDRWFDIAVLSGALAIPAGMDESDARKIRWISDPWKHLNPEQEIKAEEREIRAGLKTRSEALIERGKDPIDFDRKVHEERARESELGLVYSTNASEMSNAGVSQGNAPLADSSIEADSDIIDSEIPDEDEDDTNLVTGE